MWSVNIYIHVCVSAFTVWHYHDWATMLNDVSTCVRLSVFRIVVIDSWKSSFVYIHKITLVFTLFANQVLSQQAHRSGNFVVSWVTAYSYRYTYMQWIRKNWNINRNGFSKFLVWAFVELSFLWCVVAALHVFVCKTFAIYLLNFLKIDFAQKELWAQNYNSKID